MENSLWEKYGKILDESPEAFELDTLTIDLKALKEILSMDNGPAYEMFDSMQAIREDETEQCMGFRAVPRIFLAQLILMSEEYKTLDKKPARQ